MLSEELASLIYPNAKRSAAVAADLAGPIIARIREETQALPEDSKGFGEEVLGDVAVMNLDREPMVVDNQGKDEEVIRPDSVDVVFEVCGNKDGLPQGVRALRVGGTYVFIGLVHRDSRMNILAQTVITKCLTLIGVHNYTGKHLEEAVKFLSQHHDRYPFSSLMRPVYPLTQFRNAVEAAKSGRFFRVGINPQ
ncbi:uncharacterized protein LOC135215694 [Macrobrachium nipponense]|uniref:uncharacterized protein LOC135215694 n=1 Tax=Macrobrachium nipponense TaxID=159736 RepID=UPI0030C80B70